MTREVCTGGGVSVRVKLPDRLALSQRLVGVVALGLASVAAFLPCFLARQASASDRSTTSRYTNPNFLFSIEAPSDLHCETALPPLPNHGCHIDLDTEVKSTLAAYGEYNVFDHADPESELISNAGWLLHTGVVLKVLRRETASLGGLKAERLALRFEEPGGSVPRVRDWVVALRSVPQWGDIIYTIGLDTTEERYAQDVVHFDMMVKSWRAEEPPSK